MDAKEKAKRAEERTTRRVYDILKNHDQETRTIEAQIEAERAALEADLAEIRTRAYPRRRSLRHAPRPVVPRP